jgi:hypothetical protein
MVRLILRLLLISASMLQPFSAISQVIPSITMPASAAIFAQGSVATLGSNVARTQYGTLVYGGTIGVYFQSRSWLGIEARVPALESRGQVGHEEHERGAFVGPRFTLSRRRLKAYGVVLGGISHADYVRSPITQYANGQDVLISATEPAFQAGGGVDFRLTHRTLWRMGEVTYSHMFIPLPTGTVGLDGPTGIVFSTGLVLKIFH